MTNVEKMRRYIERTGAKLPAAYQMSMSEMMELHRMADKTPIDALCLAFEYGQAKGFRDYSNRENARHAKA